MLGVRSQHSSWVWKKRGLLPMAWSGQTSAPHPLCWEWPPRKAEKGLPRSMAAPQPPSSGDAESAFSASLLLGRSLLATSRLGGQGVGSSSRIPPAPSHGLRKVEDNNLWTQGPLKCLESQPGSFLVPLELDHQERPGTEEC